MTAWFYMLRLRSGRLYSGATTNRQQRWLDHQAGRACRTTASDPPVSLVYQETFPTFSEARQRESQIKRWTAAKKEALLRSDHAALRQLATSRERPTEAAIPLSSP